MKITKPISSIYKKSSSIVSLFVLTVIGFIALVVFISYSYNVFLNQLGVVLSEEAVESKKMQINSELMELARSRTRITSEILDIEDYFRKDELNIELESHAGRFAALRSSLLALPLSGKEQDIIKTNDAIVSKILPAQRAVVELAMSGGNEHKLKAQDILYNTVLPGQAELIDSFQELVSLEQMKIAELAEKSNISLITIKQRNLKTVIIVSVVAIMLSIIAVMRIRKNQLELRVYSTVLAQINESLELQVEERTKELSELNVLLKDSSERDELTGLYNRRKFNMFLSDEYARVNRTGSLLSLILIDIDYFKPYNDNYGHQEGDKCLSLVATIMKANLPRSIDFIARYGGEEFVIILPSTDLEGAHKVAETIREAVIDARIPHEYSNAAPYITISQGLTTYRAENSLSIAEIINNADEALYAAKANGRNRIESKSAN